MFLVDNLNVVLLIGKGSADDGDVGFVAVFVGENLNVCFLFLNWRVALALSGNAAYR